MPRADVGGVQRISLLPRHGVLAWSSDYCGSAILHGTETLWYRARKFHLRHVRLDICNVKQGFGHSDYQTDNADSNSTSLHAQDMHTMGISTASSAIYPLSSKTQ